MKHHFAAALLSALCCTVSGPTAAHGQSDERASFEELLREVVDDRLSFERPQGGSDDSWQHVPASFGSLVDRREPWHFERRQPDADEWHEAFNRWNKRWQEPEDFRHWHGWGRDWQYPHNLPAVPEPSGLALMAAGLAMLAAMRRRPG